MTDATPHPSPAITSLTAKAGDKVDNYTIMEQIGAGGTAIVFRGHDHVLNRDVAIKQIVVGRDEAGEELRQRALTEAKMHKRAAAANPRLLVQYIDTINDTRGLFLISEYVDGPSLEWRLQSDPKPMNQRDALGIIAATAKALGALHQSGMVHRDLKPSNILMPRDGGLKLADFGLASLVAEQQTMDLGSVRYMAPEVLQGQPATPRSDLYSLGMIAYELLAGRERFNEAFRTILRDQRNQSMRWVKWHTNMRAKVASLDQVVDGLPASLAQLVARLMEKDPARRVGSAEELIEAIRMHFVQTGQGESAPSTHAAMSTPVISDVSQTAALPQRSKLPMILGATLLIWVLAIGGFFFLKNQQQAEEAANRTASLITAIESADRLISDLQYVEARDAFAQIPLDHATEFDANNRRYRDDLVEAGVLKAEALLAADQHDYITALNKSREYQKRMSRWSPQPVSPRTSMSLINAKKLIEEYDTRAAFQELANEIQAMLDARKLDSAIEAIRRTRNNSTVNTAEADIRKLDELEKQYESLLGDERILELLASAKKLDESGELSDAIALLDAEAQKSGDNVDERVSNLLGVLNKRFLINSINQRIENAQNANDRAELLAAYKEMQRIQPTQSVDVRINEIEIGMMIEEAETALADGLTEKAQQLLLAVQQRDPKNAQVSRMLGSIEDAKKMAQAVRLGDQSMADREYTEAIKQYKLALSFGADPSGSVAGKIREATGQVHMAASESALANSDVEKADSELRAARENLDSSAAIDDLQARIDNLRSYTVLVGEADALFAKEDYGRAKLKYLKAAEIFDSAKIREQARECDFMIWLDLCDRAIKVRDWEAAESALKRAEEIKINDQTKSRLEKIQNRI